MTIENCLSMGYAHIGNVDELDLYAKVFESGSILYGFINLT